MLRASSINALFWFLCCGANCQFAICQERAEQRQTDSLLHNSRHYRQHIRIDKAFALRDFSHLDIHWLTEHWSIEREGMELSSLSARIDMVGKSRQKISIEFTSGEAYRQLFRIHASYYG